MKKTILFLLVLALAGCAGNIASGPSDKSRPAVSQAASVLVAASTIPVLYLGPPVQKYGPADCTPERFYGYGRANAQSPIETADYLQFASQACTITVDVRETYTLKFDHTVHAADMQMGSNTGSNLEWAFWVDFSLPSGRSFSLFMQFDKHMDNVGNRREWRVFSVPIKLPTGTVVTIRRPALPEAYCTKPGPYGSGGLACATGQKVELVGTLN
ncbi:MAG TPA: hypothetical protein VJ723_13330 [Candidatus Angelobacter sp.]|nr:hypothetical protein [Candidatus Angelobacter sp.]